MSNQINQILITQGGKKKIKETLQVSYPTIQMALEGKSKSILAERIRLTALNLGGIEVQKVNQ